MDGLPELKSAVIIFQELLVEADSVICSRTIPMHKAQLVKMVKDKGKVVLAIGDGANDVHMLTVEIVDEGSKCRSRTVW